MKDSKCDSQGSSFTQLGWGKPMHKDVIKVDREDYVQDVTYIVSDIMVIEFPSQVKNEQASLSIIGANRMLKSKNDVESNSFVIEKRMNDIDSHSQISLLN